LAGAAALVGAAARGFAFAFGFGFGLSAFFAGRALASGLRAGFALPLGFFLDSFARATLASSGRGLFSEGPAHGLPLGADVPPSVRS
jgi:hypothetical protein